MKLIKILLILVIVYLVYRLIRCPKREGFDFVDIPLERSNANNDAPHRRYSRPAGSSGLIPFNLQSDLGVDFVEYGRPEPEMEIPSGIKEGILSILDDFRKSLTQDVSSVFQSVVAKPAVEEKKEKELAQALK